MAFGQHFAARQADVRRVLLLGAGSSHDFPKYFLGQDAETIKAAGHYDTVSSPNLAEALTLLPMADLLVFSGNHAQYGTPEFQKALNDFAAAGKGIIIVHAGTWYNWPNASDYNDHFVAGGARGHGHSEFEVTVTNPNHPITKGIPATFKISDESYQLVLSHPENVEVLATLPGPALKGQPGPTQTFPSVFIVKDSRTRIVNITLGHDLAAHSNPAYQTLLLNSLQWVSQK
jgi:type 1 glutamine amidotransferase